MPKRFGLTKTERLKSRKQIDTLFASGKAVTVSPIRAIYHFTEAVEEQVIQIGVTASKKHFKRAVDRNRIKRLLREAYRLQKETLLLPALAANKSGFIFFIYTDKTIADFITIKTAIAKCLQRLSKMIPVENPS